MPLLIKNENGKQLSRQGECLLPGIGAWYALCVDVIAQLLTTVVNPCPYINLQQHVTTTDQDYLNMPIRQPCSNLKQTQNINECKAVIFMQLYKKGVHQTNLVNVPDVYIDVGGT